MNRIIFPLSFTTFLAFVYVIAAAFNFPYPIVVTLFCVLPIAIIWMVIKILKDGEHSGKTFEEYFYEF